MSLTLAQKSIYILIYNATMIGRSIGKSINGKQLADYKLALFGEIIILCKKMDSRILTNNDIIKSIDKLSKVFNISFGQSQKAINVILKYHCLLSDKNNVDSVKKVLDCPLDSIVLKHLGRKHSLAEMNKGLYIEIQNIIEKEEKNKIDLDIRIWDAQHTNEIFGNA